MRDGRIARNLEISRMNPLTIADVAAEAQVSTTTVSRVINDHPDVATQTRKRVLDAIERLDYRPKGSRRHRMRPTVHSIAVIMHAADNEYVGTLLRGILDQLDQEDGQAIVHLTDVQTEREMGYMRHAIDNGCEGILIVTPCTPSKALLSLICNRIPLVLIDTYPESPNVSYVRATNWQGAREATNYLLSLGHRAIGFVAGRRTDHITEAREHGYRSALIDAGIAYDPRLTRDGDYGRVSGFQAGLALLSLAPRPTAVFCCSDLMAMGLMEAAYLKGVRIPEELSVVGFDDLPLAATLHPALTTVRQPLYEMGRMAAQMVMALTRGEEIVMSQVELPTRLIIRDSCAPPLHDDEARFPIMSSR